MKLFKEFCKGPAVGGSVAAGDEERHKHFAAASVKFASLNQGEKIVIFFALRHRYPQKSEVIVFGRGHANPFFRNNNHCKSSFFTSVISNGRDGRIFVPNYSENIVAARCEFTAGGDYIFIIAHGYTESPLK